MANLSDLVLLRNDPVVAAEFYQAAQQGDIDAQYGMGLIYAEGRGVDQDEAKAFYWLTCAIEQGDSGADVLRKVVAAGMTEEQIIRARLLLKAGRPVQGKTGRKRHHSRKHKQHQTGLH
jgi:TPR repeat protein